MIEEEKEARRQSTLRQKELDEKFKGIHGKRSGITKVTKTPTPGRNQIEWPRQSTKTSGMSPMADKNLPLID